MMKDPNASLGRPPVSEFQGFNSTDSRAALDLISIVARLLFVNGQTTERMEEAAAKIASRLGVRASVLPHWDELTVQVDDAAGSHYKIVAASPVNMDMNKVAAAMGLVDRFCDGLSDPAEAKSRFESIDHFPPVSTVRFALMAAAGAAALGVIFGVAHSLSLAAIAFSAGSGACLRRWLSEKSGNLFVQPFCAALLAGVVGAIVVRMRLSSALRLVAVCPCMVLVPGPHFLNGAIDFVRGRVGLGAARFVYANLITTMICVGLLIGLSLGGIRLPASGPFHSVAIEYDVTAAAVAVAAYGTFFAMPWRMLPVPILIGMFAHALRWAAISLAGTSAVTGAFVACFVVGVFMTPIADRLRLPFAGFAFASVVSLIPGVFLFQMAGGMVELATLRTGAPQDLAVQVLADGTTAILVILAMGFGLIVPKMCIEHIVRPVAFGHSPSG